VLLFLGSLQPILASLQSEDLALAGDFPNDASELPGSNTLGDVVPAVRCSSCVVCFRGDFECQNARFGIWGVASTIRNNLIADLLFLRKCHAHAPAQSLLRLGPRSWAFASDFLKFKLANVAVWVPCPYRIWSLAVLHARHHASRGAGGTHEGSGCMHAPLGEL
jgi:hypothetical protein